MRVLHLLPDLRVGGGQTVVLGLLRQLDHDRFDVRVASLGGPAELRAEFAEAAGSPPVELGASAGGTAGAVAAVTRLLRRERADVLHVHSPPDRTAGHLAALATGVPVVGHLHSEWVHLRPSGRLGARQRLTGSVRLAAERRAVRHYVAASAHVAALFAAATTTPITVLPPATDVTAPPPAERARLRSELGLDPDVPVLLHVARIVEGKGHDDLVPLLQDVRARFPGTVLLLVGDGDRSAAFRSAADAAGLADAVRLLGRREDVPALMAAADLLVFPSASEGLGLVVLEAMATGLPVAAYDLPAFGEFARDGETGAFVPPGAREELTKAVIELLADPARRAAMGRAGRDTVDHSFRWPVAAATLAGVYERVAAERRRR
ncbi:glycosyltransferase [Jiangella mangrovi]|uniref:Glycosyltransferase involved in cell wall biosynthesis n=1 Tax=Jiangella mangrovi TaxID=1524084 RepID=A0A7W9GLT0_9ACTN|nr:glycosyltransferase involved in cell wall biosynthesis [Jiangella mangrovi]